MHVSTYDTVCDHFGMQHWTIAIKQIYHCDIFKNYNVKIDKLAMEKSRKIKCISLSTNELDIYKRYFV